MNDLYSSEKHDYPAKKERRKYHSLYGEICSVHISVVLLTIIVNDYSQIANVIAQAAIGVANVNNL